MTLYVLVSVVLSLCGGLVDTLCTCICSTVIMWRVWLTRYVLVSVVLSLCGGSG